MRFLKWDYDNMEVVEYKRVGECNGCGDCCKQEIHYRLAGKHTNTWGAGIMGNTVNAEGVWSEYGYGNSRRFIKLDFVKDGNPCPLLKDNRCTMHAEKSIKIGGQGALCLAWPIIPEHVELYNNCSYTFEEIGRRPIGGKHD